MKTLKYEGNNYYYVDAEWDQDTYEFVEDAHSKKELILRLVAGTDKLYDADDFATANLGLDWDWDLCDGYCYYVGTYEDIDGGQYQIWGPKKYDDDPLEEYYHVYTPDGTHLSDDDLDAWDFTLCNPGADIRMPISTDDYCNSDCGDTYYVRESLSDEEIDHYAELLYEHSDCRSDEPDDVEAKLWDFGFKPEDWEIEAVCDQIAGIEHMTRAEQDAIEKRVGRRLLTIAELEEAMEALEDEEYDDDDDDDDNN